MVLKQMTIGAPIKDFKTIEAIKNLYIKKERLQDLLLFSLAINTGFNLVDLLKLNVKDIKDKFYLSISNKSVPLNDEIRSLILKITEGKELSSPLFVNKQNKRLDRVTVFCSFKEICEELGLKNTNVSSWRKTFAYHYYRKYKDLSYLQWLFNQTTVDLTLKFIGVDENMNLRYRKGVCL